MPLTNRTRARFRMMLLLALLFACPTAWAASIDSSDFCVTDTDFHFDVTVTGDGDELIFRIGADDELFVAEGERIAVNFDSATGAITRQEPVVETFESPDFDRWEDGLIADFEFVDLGGFSWRLVGSVPHGSDPFVQGDTVWGIAVRPGNLFSLDLPVTACEVDEVVLDVPSTTSEPTIDGFLSFGEWDDAIIHDIDHGFLAFVHDRDRLYLLIDLLEDRVSDAFALGGGDQFWLYFDVDEDGAITPDVDLRYRLEPGTGNLRYQTFCGDCLFGFNALEPSTFSSRGEGFGCFIEDFTFQIYPPPLTCDSHRVWEVALDLGEIGMRDQTGKLGYLVASGTPLFNETFPTNLNDLASYADVTLAEEPRQLRSQGPGPMDPQFEITQAIQTPDNDSDLAAGKPTAIRVWDEANDSLVGILTYGQRNGIDLPGSPLLDVTSLYSSTSSRAPRDTIVWNLTRRLPDEWATGGTVDFDVLIRGLDDSDVTALSGDLDFAPTDAPVFWTVPVRNTLANGTVTQPATANFITQSEQALRLSAPIEEIEFVRRPILDITNVTTSAGLIDELKEYDQQAILAWTFGLLLTGESPFDLPDQITGFIPTGLSNFGGYSDPVWLSGNGRVTWVAQTITGGGYGYVHEVNHNLDTDPNGTWGRHSQGCGAQNRGPDPSWPYGTSSSIQEVGLQWTTTQFSSVNDTVPDIMSYCASNMISQPAQWFSPYRWDAWLDLFRTDAAAVVSAGNLESAGGTQKRKRSDNGISRLNVTIDGAAPEDRFYVMGKVFPDGTGHLGQILRQPGPLMVGDETGEYSVRVLDCDGAVLTQAGFTPAFIDVEGEPLDYVSFDYILPAPPESCALELNREGLVLDTREISDNPPEVALLTPNGGENWSGVETATWDAFDADGDGLTFSLFYSFDGGMTWLPVASRIIGNSHEIDTAKLPGSDDARLRVLVTDGAATAHDDSDAAFSLAMKPPSVQILSPADNGVYDVNEPLDMEGLARNTFGQALEPQALIWAVSDVPAGTGETLSIHLDEGQYTITLAAEDSGGNVGMAAVDITMADLDGAGDPADVDLPAVDLSGSKAFVAGDRLVCEMTVRSGKHGLESKSRFACHLDFDDLETESESGCDADNDGQLLSSYRLGDNHHCSTSDVALTYRHDRRGGDCTGGPGTVCSTTEFGSNGVSDDTCDGMVNGGDAETCRVTVSGLLATIAGERAAQCGESDDCLGGIDDLESAWSAYTFFEAHLRHYRDRLPDTDDGETPDSTDEVLVIPLQQ